MRVTSPAVTVKDIWDALTVTYGVAGSYGALVETNLDSKVSLAKADLTTLETRLTAARAVALDELLPANLPADVATIPTNPALATTWTAALATALANYTAARANRLDCIARGVMITPSNEIQLSDDAEVSNDTTTYTKKKEVLLVVPGRYRVKFDLKSPGDAAHAARGRIYVNGIAVGTERSTVSTTYVTYSEDIDVVTDDLVQLYLMNTTAGQLAVAANFRVCGYYLIGVGMARSV